MTPEQRANKIVRSVHGTNTARWPNGLANAIAEAIREAEEGSESRLRKVAEAARIVATGPPDQQYTALQRLREAVNELDAARPA